MSKTAAAKPGRRWAVRLREEVRGYAQALLIAFLVVTFAFTSVGVSGTSMEPNLNGGDRGDSLLRSLIKGDRVFIPKYDTWLRRIGVGGAYERGEVVVLREPANAPSALVSGKRNFYIKRIIGVPGDRLRIAGGQVFVNGAPLDQSFITQAGTVDVAPIDFPKVLVQDQEVSGLVMGFVGLPGGAFAPQLPLAHAPGPVLALSDPRVQLYYGNVVDALVAPPAGTPDGPLVVDLVVPPGHYFVMGDNRSLNGSEDSRYFGAVPALSIAGRATAVIWPPRRQGQWNFRRLSPPPGFAELAGP